MWANLVRIASAQLVDELLAEHDVDTAMRMVYNRLQRVQDDMANLDRALQAALQVHEH